MKSKGGNWPTTSALYLASFITIKSCTYKNDDLVVSNGSSVASVIKILEKNICSTDEESKVSFYLIISNNFS